MFQQSRSLHAMDSMDFLVHQKMSERMLSVSQQQQQQPPALNLESGGNQSAGSGSKRSRVDQPIATYDHSPAVNFYPMVDPASSVVLTRCEYDTMRQEVINLKRALADFRSSVDTEIETLKKENKLLKRQVSSLRSPGKGPLNGCMCVDDKTRCFHHCFRLMQCAVRAGSMLSFCQQNCLHFYTVYMIKCNCTALRENL